MFFFFLNILCDVDFLKCSFVEYLFIFIQECYFFPPYKFFEIISLGSLSYILCYIFQYVGLCSDTKMANPVFSKDMTKR